MRRAWVCTLMMSALVIMAASSGRAAGPNGGLAAWCSAKFWRKEVEKAKEDPRAPLENAVAPASFGVDAHRGGYRTAFRRTNRPEFAKFLAGEFLSIPSRNGKRFWRGRLLEFDAKDQPVIQLDDGKTVAVPEGEADYAGVARGRSMPELHFRVGRTFYFRLRKKTKALSSGRVVGFTESGGILIDHANAFDADPLVESARGPIELMPSEIEEYREAYEAPNSARWKKPGPADTFGPAIYQGGELFYLRFKKNPERIYRVRIQRRNGARNDDPALDAIDLERPGSEPWRLAPSDIEAYQPFVANRPGRFGWKRIAVAEAHVRRGLGRLYGANEAKALKILKEGLASPDLQLAVSAKLIDWQIDRSPLLPEAEAALIRAAPSDARVLAKLEESSADSGSFEAAARVLVALSAGPRGQQVEPYLEGALVRSGSASKARLIASALSRNGPDRLLELLKDESCSDAGLQALFEALMPYSGQPEIRSLLIEKLYGKADRISNYDRDYQGVDLVRIFALERPQSEEVTRALVALLSKDLSVHDAASTLETLLGRVSPAEFSELLIAAEKKAKNHERRVGEDPILKIALQPRAIDAGHAAEVARLAAERLPEYWQAFKVLDVMRKSLPQDFTDAGITEKILNGRQIGRMDDWPVYRIETEIVETAKSYGATPAQLVKFGPLDVESMYPATANDAAVFRAFLVSSRSIEDLRAIQRSLAKLGPELSHAMIAPSDLLLALALERGSTPKIIEDLKQGRVPPNGREVELMKVAGRIGQPPGYVRYVFESKFSRYGKDAGTQMTKAFFLGKGLTVDQIARYAGEKGAYPGSLFRFLMLMASGKTTPEGLGEWVARLRASHRMLNDDRLLRAIDLIVLEGKDEPADLFSRQTDEIPYLTALFQSPLGVQLAVFDNPPPRK